MNDTMIIYRVVDKNDKPLETNANGYGTAPRTYFKRHTAQGVATRANNEGFGNYRAVEEDRLPYRVQVAEVHWKELNDI